MRGGAEAWERGVRVGERKWEGVVGEGEGVGRGERVGMGREV